MDRQELLKQRFELMEKRKDLVKQIDEITKNDPVFPEGVNYLVNRPRDIEAKLLCLRCEHSEIINKLDDNKDLLKVVK